MDKSTMKKDLSKESVSGVSLLKLLTMVSITICSLLFLNEYRKEVAITDDARLISNAINKLDFGEPHDVLQGLQVKASPLSPVEKYYLVSVSVNGERYYVMENKDSRLCVKLRVNYKVDVNEFYNDSGDYNLNFGKIIKDCESNDVIRLIPLKK